MILNNPIPPSPYILEGTVYEVDLKRWVCKCKTNGGQVMKSVPWSAASGGAGRSGVVTSPRVGDRVYISTHTGAPVIIGFKSIIYEQYLGESNHIVDGPVDIDSVDTGNLSFMSDPTLRVNQALPPDAVVGDHLLSTEGGSLVGALRGGSVVLKASPLAQVYLTKLDDLYRVMSRNQEHFSDAHTDVVANRDNRPYRFLGYADTVKDVRQDRYNYFELYGDTAAAEAFKGKYRVVEPSAVPENEDILRVSQVSSFNVSGDDGYEDAYEPLYRSELFKDGSLIEVSRTADGANESTVTLDHLQHIAQVHDDQEDSFRSETAGLIQDRVNGSNGYSNISQSGDEIELDWDGKATITENSSGITIDWKGQGTVTITDSGITCDWNGSSKTVLTSSSATVESNGHKMIVSASGIAMS